MLVDRLAEDAERNAAAGEIAVRPQPPFQERRTGAGWFWRRWRLDTPLRLFSSVEIATLGGEVTRRCP